MDRDEPGLGRHLGPVADAADVARILQGDHRQPHGLALLDADRHRLRRHGLAEAIEAVDHRQHRRLGHDLGRPVRVHHAVALPAQIARHARHAVAVVSCQIGRYQVLADAPGLRLGASRLCKNLAHQLGQRPRLDRHHFPRIPLPDLAPQAAPHHSAGGRPSHRTSPASHRTSRTDLHARPARLSDCRSHATMLGAIASSIRRAAGQHCIAATGSRSSARASAD